MNIQIGKGATRGQVRLFPSMIFTVVFFLIGQTACFATTVTLQWDANADHDLAGYKVHYQADSFFPPFDGCAPIDVGNTTSATISGLDSSHAYYFAVTAYNTSGEESAYSDIIGVPEMVSPTVSITNPSKYSRISGTIPVTASASDNVGVSKVEFYVNNSLQAACTASPYQFTWTTSSLTNGSYTLAAKAYDAAGNIGLSDSIPVTVYVPANGVTLTPGVASPTSVNTPVTFTAAASGGSGKYQYRYLLRVPGRTLVVIRDYSNAATWNWATAGLAAGTYQVVVHARNAGSTKSYETYQSISYVLAPPANGVTLTPGVVSPTTAGTPVTFTGLASGGSGKYQYKFLLEAPGAITYTTVRDYSAAATWNWPTAGLAPGTYNVLVYARNAGSTSSVETYKRISYVLASPASSVTLTSSVASPTSVNTPVTFTAAASGGSGKYQYRYLLRVPGRTLVVIRDYSNAATWNWATAGLAAGTYQVVVHARNAGSTKSYETYQSINYVLAPPANGVTLTPGVASPTSVNTPVTFTAAASGGSGKYQYRYLLRVPGRTLVVIRDYSNAATWNWATAGLAAGTYQVVVHARNAGSTKSYETYQSISFVLK